MDHVEYLQRLQIPPEYCRLEVESNDLLLWKAEASMVLNQLTSDELPAPSSHEGSVGVMRLAAFIGPDRFSSSSMSQTATALLDRYISRISSPSERRDLFRNVLELGIKPLFLTSAHPRLNPESGRKLARPAGGDAASQDMFQDQRWKREHGQGCWNVIRWCVQHMEPEEMETLWPLLIPPLLTLVDDYEPAFKLRGILAMGDMLERVNPDLLRRTGLDALVLTSLSTALSFLTNPESPDLFRAAVHCYTALVERTTTPGSQKRFEMLWELVANDIIGGAWVYGTSSRELMEASVESLAPIVRSLGIGSVRFLKALVPQLAEFMVTKPSARTAPRLQLLSCNCMCVVVRECRPRVPSWTYRILDALLRCWVETVEKRPEDVELLASLRELARELLLVSPGLEEIEVPRLCNTDAAVFRPLFVR